MIDRLAELYEGVVELLAEARAENARLASTRHARVKGYNPCMEEVERLEAENARLALIVEQSRDLNQKLYDRAEGLEATVAQLREAAQQVRHLFFQHYSGNPDWLRLPLVSGTYMGQAEIILERVLAATAPKEEP